MRFLLLAAGLFAISGCSAQDAAAPDIAPENQITENQQAVGIANPASEYCVEQGGRVDIHDGEDGQTGFCHLPDGTIVEEWDYFRAAGEAANPPDESPAEP